MAEQGTAVAGPKAKPTNNPGLFELRRDPADGLKIFLRRIDDLPAERLGDVKLTKERPLTNLELIRVLAEAKPYGISDLCDAMREQGYTDRDIQAFLNMVEYGIQTHRAGTEGSKTVPAAIKFRGQDASIPDTERLAPWEEKIVDTVVNWVRFFSTGEYPVDYSYFAGRAGA